MKRKHLAHTPTVTQPLGTSSAPCGRGNHALVARLPLLVSLLTAMTVLATPERAAAQQAVPKVVVNILIDQLRSDYLHAFMPLYGEEGFARLLREGKVYTQAAYPHYRPDRASAAATLATGTTPYNHGVVGLQWIDRTTLRPVHCVDDEHYTGIQTTDHTAPTYLGVSTFGDELKVATEGKALVYAVAPFRDAAVLTAGHAADGAVWVDDGTGLWCSTSYYGASLPSWAAVLNTQSLASRIASLTWRPKNDLVGNFSYFLSGGIKTPFAHTFEEADRFKAYKTSGLINGDVAAAACQCLEGTMLGTDDVTDYLAVTFYAGNYRHRTVSEAPMELQDTYVRLDDAVAQLVNRVEHKVGKGRALFVLTSTGYTDEETADLSRFRIPTGTFDVPRAAGLLNMYLVAVYGQGKFVETTFGTQIYLNHKLIEQKQINMAELLERTQDFLLQLSGVKDVYTSTRLMQGAWTPGISSIRGAYNPRYSGDVLIEVSPGWHYVNASHHDNRLVRESYIPFPIIFMGQGFKSDPVNTPATTDYIAPTLSEAVRIRAPNACSHPALP